MLIFFSGSTLGVILYSSSMPNYTTISFGELTIQLALNNHRELHPSIIPSFVARKSDVSEAIEILNEHTSNTTIHITAVERAAWNAKMDGDSELISIADIDAICSQSIEPASEVLL